MKKISVIMAVILVFCLSAPICQAQSNGSDYSNPSTSNESITPEMQSFINYISVFFENSHTFVAIDFNGNDISAEFYNSNYSLYDSNEFGSLKVVADSQIAYILEKGTQADAMSSSTYSGEVPTMTHYVSNYRLFYTQPPAPYSSQEYFTMLTSSFVENPISGYIVSAQSPALTVYHDGGGVYPYELSNVIIYAPTKSSGRVTFSARFSLYKVIDTTRNYSGTFTHTDTYDSSGNLV